MRCATAILIVAGDLNKAANRAVNVVPIFAPTIKGYTSLNLIFPVATKGTTIEVVTELDCMVAVSAAPHPKDFSGLLKIIFSNFNLVVPINNL